MDQIEMEKKEEGPAFFYQKIEEHYQLLLAGRPDNKENWTLLREEAQEVTKRWYREWVYYIE